jgi:U4/U6 small nuclear ribonucleoprotein PRP3
MPPPSTESRKHPRDEEDRYNRHDDYSKKRKSADGRGLPSPRHLAEEKSPAPAPAKKSTAEDIAAAKARIAEIMKKQRPQGGTSAASKSIDDRIAAAKARVAAKSEVIQQSIQAMAQAEEDSKRARGGLAVNVHPSLLADLPTSVDRRRGNVGPKFSTALANLNRQADAKLREMEKEKAEKEKERRLQIYTKPAQEDFSTENPYFDAKLDTAYSVQKERRARPLEFNPQGKFIDRANKERMRIKMEELAKSIEARKRKAGLEEDLDVGDKEVLKRDEPPEIEWWDEDYLATKSYDDIDTGKLKLDGEDTKITLYIQNPVPIPPPTVTNAPPPRPIMMTPKEMAKARRLRRAEEQKDLRGKRLLGLLPPEPPKIKLSNMMKVLTSEAIQDPTAVERRVRREIEARKEKHEQDNEARKLTKEQRHQKDSERRVADVAKTGLHCCLFRVENLGNPSHRFKVNKTAQQLELTGIIIHHPKTNIVVVEGGLQAIKKYKRLLTVRINWTDNSRNATIREGNREMLGDQPEPEDLSGNRCELVWEGELRTRNFKTWIGEREASNDADARRFLGKNAENFWKLAVRTDDV